MNVERTSQATNGDYEKPELNVADLPAPVTLSASKVRQAVLEASSRLSGGTIVDS